MKNNQSNIFTHMKPSCIIQKQPVPPFWGMYLPPHPQTLHTGMNNLTNTLNSHFNSNTSTFAPTLDRNNDRVNPNISSNSNFPSIHNHRPDGNEEQLQLMKHLSLPSNNRGDDNESSNLSNEPDSVIVKDLIEELVKERINNRNWEGIINVIKNYKNDQNIKTIFKLEVASQDKQTLLKIALEITNQELLQVLVQSADIEELTKYLRVNNDLLKDDLMLEVIEKTGNIKLLQYFLVLKAEIDFENVKNYIDNNLYLINLQDALGNTLLHLLIEASLQVTEFNEGFAEYLVEKGADINIKNYLGRSLIFSARSAQVIKFFLKNNADTNSSDLREEKINFLNAVIKDENYNLIKMLIDKGMDVHFTSPNYGTIFTMLCVQTGSSNYDNNNNEVVDKKLEIISYLIEQNVIDVNFFCEVNYKFHPIYNTVNSSSKLLSFFLRKGALINFGYLDHTNEESLNLLYTAYMVDELSSTSYSAYMKHILYFVHSQNIPSPIFDKLLNEDVKEVFLGRLLHNLQTYGVSFLTLDDFFIYLSKLNINNLYDEPKISFEIKHLPDLLLNEVKMVIKKLDDEVKAKLPEIEKQIIIYYEKIEESQIAEFLLDNRCNDCGEYIQKKLANPTELLFKMKNSKELTDNIISLQKLYFDKPTKNNLRIIMEKYSKLPPLDLEIMKLQQDYINNLEKQFKDLKKTNEEQAEKLKELEINLSLIEHKENFTIMEVENIGDYSNNITDNEF